MTPTTDSTAGDDTGRAPAPTAVAGVPEGFTVMRMPTNPFVDGVGPLYGRLDGERFVLGIRIEKRHCNPGGTCHGGMIMTLSDMLLLMGSNIEGGVNRYFTTVNVTCDFIGPAHEGDWVEGRMQVLRVARSLVFAQGLFTAGDAMVARCSGILKPVSEPDPRYDGRRYFTG
ncbi:MAG: PaaI family thioesterase [Betaproteobacteria bacterium]|jgi:uncharacterized protein (TIGR00369 family)|nr:PaaI family thioesterase [Betaproteobacteria bacterium]